jgi:hypothetical protein
VAPAQRHPKGHLLVTNGTRAGWCDPVGPGQCQPEGILDTSSPRRGPEGTSTVEPRPLHFELAGEGWGVGAELPAGGPQFKDGHESLAHCWRH